MQNLCNVIKVNTNINVDCHEYIIDKLSTYDDIVLITLRNSIYIYFTLGL